MKFVGFPVAFGTSKILAILQIHTITSTFNAKLIHKIFPRFDSSSCALLLNESDTLHTRANILKWWCHKEQVWLDLIAVPHIIIVWMRTVLRRMNHPNVKEFPENKGER